MISIVITSSKEPRTISRAIESFLNQQITTPYEILVVAPDEPTLRIAKSYSLKNKNVKVLKDKGIGKPAALNDAFKKVRGNIVVLTDGDVFVGNDSVNFLIECLKDKTVGAVTGKIISLNNKNNMFGYWAYLLTEGFHNLRLQEIKRKNATVCSGYLYAIRKSLLPILPLNVLADDAYISNNVVEKGYKIEYEPRARVFVNYPNHLVDWIRQKKRTASRLYQSNQNPIGTKFSGFGDEMLSALKVLTKIRTPQHLIWFCFLVVMRLYIWFRIFFDFRLWRRPLKDAWQRVQSTK